MWKDLAWSFLKPGPVANPHSQGPPAVKPKPVIDKQTGFVTDGTDLQQVTTQLEKLLNDPHLRTQMGSAGYDYACQFDWGNVVQRTIDVVENIV